MRRDEVEVLRMLMRKIKANVMRTMPRSKTRRIILLYLIIKIDLSKKKK